MAGLILSGDLIFDRLDAAGRKTGAVYLGNTTNFTINQEVETKSRISRQRASFGAALDTVNIPQPVTVDLTIDEFNTHTLQIALLGDTSNVTQAAGATATATQVDDEDFTSDYGVAVQLDHDALVRGSVVVTNVGGGTVYDEGDDYTIDDADGTITVLSTGSMADATGYKISYRYAAAGGIEVTAKLGAWVKLPHEALDPQTVIVAPQGGGAALVLGDDYEINARLGMIRALTGGSIADDQVIVVGYEYAEVKKSVIKGGVNSLIRGEIILDGRNLVTGESVRFVAPQVGLAPNGGIQLINSGGDFGEFQATATLTVPEGQDEAFSLETIAA